MEFSSIRDLVTGDEVPVTWLIPDFLPQGALVALAGSPGAGKSFLAYTLSMAVATGTPFLNFNASAAEKVLYFDQENSPHDSAQYWRWAYNGLGAPPLDWVDHIAYAHWQLGQPSWALECGNAILAHRPKLIVFDTCSAVFNIDDENDNAEATRIVNRIRILQRTIVPYPTVIILKHAKFNADAGGYTMRGAKAWEGAVDAVMYQIRNEGAPRADGLRGTRLEPAKTRAFGLRQVLKIDPQWTNQRKGLRLTYNAEGVYHPRIGRD